MYSHLLGLNTAIASFADAIIDSPVQLNHSVPLQSYNPRRFLSSIPLVGGVPCSVWPPAVWRANHVTSCVCHFLAWVCVYLTDRRTGTGRFESSSQQYAYVYSNSSASVAFLENDAATAVTVQFQGHSVTLSPSSVLVYDAVAHTPVFDTFSVQAPITQREFEQVCVGGGEV